MATKRVVKKSAPKKKVARKTPANKVAAKKSVKKPQHPLMLDGHDWNRRLVIDYVCDNLVCSSNGIGNILKAGYTNESGLHNLPSYSTFMKWLDDDGEGEEGRLSYSEMYARAKEAQADFMADEILDIADDGANDWMERHDKDGGNIGWQLNGEHVQRSRLRIESRKWLAAKLKAKKYGDKVQQEVTGPGGGPLQTQDLSIDFDGLEKSDRDAIRKLLSKSAT